VTAIVRSETGTGEYAAATVERQGEMEVARMRHVQLGDVIGNGIVVLKGLEVGEQVIVTGASLLVDGEPVRVIAVAPHPRFALPLPRGPRGERVSRGRSAEDGRASPTV
jgi:hypothetical protein